jgi:hypothetical protein
MRRPAVTAAGFALAGGVPVDPSGLVHISPGADRAGRLLLACVEPTDQSPRGLELAAVTLRVIRDTFAITTGSPADALLAAFERANVALLAQNRPLATGRWQRRICVGATAVAIADRQIAVVQSPPSQAIFVQDDQHYAFPDLASWRGDSRRIVLRGRRNHSASPTPSRPVCISHRQSRVTSSSSVRRTSLEYWPKTRKRCSRCLAAKC